MPTIDLAFALQGSTIPLDYGYALFGALSRIVEQIHGDRRIGVHPIRGMRIQPRRLTLVPQSRLRIRLPSEEVATYLSLAGKVLDLEGARLAIGIPSVESLRPAANLMSRLVTLGHRQEASEFEQSAREQLKALGVSVPPAFIP